MVEIVYERAIDDGVDEGIKKRREAVGIGLKSREPRLSSALFDKCTTSKADYRSRLTSYATRTRMFPAVAIHVRRPPPVLLLPIQINYSSSIPR